MADNEWYIDEKFLLKTRKFYNPTRLSENSLRAYWTLWYDLENSDQPLTFKQVGLKPNQLESDGRSSEAEGKGEEQEISDNGEKQADEGEIPKSCKSEKEKLLFLRSLLPQHQRDFHSIINAVAPMEVCPVHASS